MFWDVTCDSTVVVLPVLLIFFYLAAVILSTTTTGVYFQYRKEVLPAAIVNAHLAFCIVGCVVYFFFSSVMWLWSAKYSLTRPKRNWRLCIGVWGICLFKDAPLLIIETCAIFRTGWHDSGLQVTTFIIQIVLAIVSIIFTSMSFSWYSAGFLERNFGISTEDVMPGHGRGRTPYAARMASVAAMGRPPPLMLQETRLPVLRIPMSAPTSRQLSPRRPQRDWDVPPLPNDALRAVADDNSPYRLNRFIVVDPQEPLRSPDPPVRHYGPPPII